MAEILHQLIGDPIIYTGVYIPGGAGFQPSTVSTSIMEGNKGFERCSFLFCIQQPPRKCMDLSFFAKNSAFGAKKINN